MFTRFKKYPSNAPQQKASQHINNACGAFFKVFLNSYVQFFYFFSNINLLISAFIVSALAKMQDEQTTLAEAVKLYAEAASLMEYCHTALEKTSLQIEEIDAKITQTMQEQWEEN